MRGSLREIAKQARTIYTIMSKPKSTQADNDIVAVTAIEITIAGIKLSLSLEQVKELKQKLAEAFPEPITKTVHIPGPERVVFRERPPVTWQTAKPSRLNPPFEITCMQETLHRGEN